MLAWNVTATSSASYRALNAFTKRDPELRANNEAGTDPHSTECGIWAPQTRKMASLLPSPSMRSRAMPLRIRVGVQPITEHFGANERQARHRRIRLDWIIAANTSQFLFPRHRSRRGCGIAASIEFARKIVVASRTNPIEAGDDQKAEIEVALQFRLKCTEIIECRKGHTSLRTHVSAAYEISLGCSPRAERIAGSAEGLQLDPSAIYFDCDFANANVRACWC